MSLQQQRLPNRATRELIFIRNANTGRRELRGGGGDVIRKKVRVKMMKGRRYTACIALFSRRNRKSYVKSTRAETDNFTRYSHNSRSTTTVRETVSRNGTWSTDSSGSNGKVISLGNIPGTRPLRQLLRFASLLIFLPADRPMRFDFFFHFFFFR